LLFFSNLFTVLNLLHQIKSKEKTKKHMIKKITFAVIVILVAIQFIPMEKK